MKEKWFRRKIIGTEGNRYYIKELIDDYDGLRVVMWDGKENGNLVMIDFGFIESYRYCDEGLRLELFGRLSKEYGDRFYGDWNLFEVKDSEYLEWLNKSSCEVAEEMALKHYVVMDYISVLDVVFTGEPEFKKIKNVIISFEF